MLTCQKINIMFKPNDLVLLHSEDIFLLKNKFERLKLSQQFFLVKLIEQYKEERYVSAWTVEIIDKKIRDIWFQVGVHDHRYIYNVPSGAFKRLEIPGDSVEILSI